MSTFVRQWLLLPSSYGLTQRGQKIPMNTNTLLLIIVVVLLLGGGGFYFR